jgi:hypothetical protein
VSELGRNPLYQTKMVRHASVESLVALSHEITPLLQVTLPAAILDLGRSHN